MSSLYRFLLDLNKADETQSRFRDAVHTCTFTEYRLLAAVQREHEKTSWNGDARGQRLGELSIERGIYPQGVGRIAKDLASRGLLVVVTDPIDSRARNLHLTSEGTKLVNFCHQVVEGIIRPNRPLHKIKG